MSKAAEFVSSLFSALNRQKIEYCVLRNYDGLPEKVGNDIDIWVESSQAQDAQEILLQCAQRSGWALTRVLLRLYHYPAGRYFFNKRGEDGAHDILEIDIVESLSWKGTSYVDETFLAKHLLPHPKGFPIPSPGIEASILLLKTLLFEGKVLEKYRQRIVTLSTKDPKTFVESLSKPFGRRTADAILSMAKEEKWAEIEKSKHSLQWRLVIRAVANNPLLQARQTALYFYSRLRERLSAKCGFFLVLIGPDGSGKTTTANMLLESEAIKKLFPNRTYFYRNFSFMPELKTIASLFGIRPKQQETETSKREGTTVPFGVLRSMIYPIYYGFEYFLGRFWLWREKGQHCTITVFDRYFYEYFLQKQFMKCPQWFLSLISRIIAQPDALVFLQNEPEVVYTRKQELSVEEIAQYSQVCARIVDLHPNGFTVHTSSKEDVLNEIQGIVISQLQRKQCAVLHKVGWRERGSKDN